jgi:ATP-binding cassette subfamily B protein
MIGSVLLDFLSVLCSIIPIIGLYMIINNVIENGETKVLYIWALVICISIIGKIVFHGMALRISHIVAYDILFEIRKKLVFKYSKVSQGYLEENSSGKLKKIIFDDVESLEQFYGHHVPEILSSIFIPLVMSVIVFFLDIRVWIVLMIPIVIFLVCLKKTNILQGKNFQTMFMTQQKLNSSLVEYINGMKEIKVFGGEEKAAGKFEEAAEAYSNFMVKWFKDSRHLMTMSSIVLSSGIIFVFPAVGYLHHIGEIDISRTMLYIFVSLGIYAPLAKIPQLTDVLSLNAHIAGRVSSMLELPELAANDSELKLLDGDIVFEKVSFGYDENNVLEDFSITAKKNEVIGIVGPSGSGKSTILKLVARFWDVSKGTISIGKTDIKEVSQEGLAKSIAYVTQNVCIFDMSILDNIRIGQPDATEKEIISAAKKAQCHDFIMKLPEGYNTLLGSEGVHLSGGEKQRIAIARAIIKNAQILLLDEATAYIDPDNEYNLQMALSKLMLDKTVIIVAHRLSTIVDADKIYVLDKGKVVEKGKHAELVENNGLYSSMWSKFNSSQEIALGKPANKKSIEK